MSIEEQKIKQEAYSEAIRYMENAKKTLEKAGKEDHYYKDRVSVKAACSIAYNSVLLVLDAYLSLKGIKKPKGQKSIKYYFDHLDGIDKKLLRQANNAYEILHLFGYYGGVLDMHVVKAGFDEAYEIINKIKPEQP
jgi:peptidoglycan/xylan/chitin deacetylase (PgdA/CDA1 family)